MTIINALRELGRDLLALIWPTACVSCGAPDRDCCARCLVELRRGIPIVVTSGPTPVFARGFYEGPLRAILVAYKHGGRTVFTRELGRQMRVPMLAALRQGGSAPPIVVAAPSRPVSVRRRGYRHVDTLLSAALRGQGATVLRLRALRTLPGRSSQVGLGSNERASNAALIGVRRVTRSVLRGRDVILVDDVMTTGATIHAARDTLEAAGARVVAVVVLCVAERRDTRPRAATGNRVGEWSRVPERRKGAPHRPTA